MKGLGEYLTSEDDEILGKGLYTVRLRKISCDIPFSGVELLSLVVARVPKDKLNQQSGTANDCKN